MPIAGTPKLRAVESEVGHCGLHNRCRLRCNWYEPDLSQSVVSIPRAEKIGLIDVRVQQQRSLLSMERLEIVYLRLIGRIRPESSDFAV